MLDNKEEFSERSFTSTASLRGPPTGEGPTQITEAAFVEAHNLKESVNG